MSATYLPAEQRIAISSVSWETYGALVDEVQTAGKRMAFDQGVLEIMSPMIPHETAKRLLGRMIERFTEIHGIDLLSSASTTFRRSDLRRGFEADESYYIAHAGEVRGKDRIDLSIDPPPDLVIEIELTRSAIDKLELFASMGVAELWRYDQDRLWLGHLSKGSYTRAEESQQLPGFPIVLAEQLLARRGSDSETALIREFVRAAAPNQD